MEQEVRKEQETSSFTKKIGQTTFRVNVYFAENTTATFENKLLHLMANDIGGLSFRQDLIFCIMVTVRLAIIKA